MQVLPKIGLAVSLMMTSATPATAFEYDFGTRTNRDAWQISVNNGESFSPWPEQLGTPGVWLGLFEFFLPEEAQDVNLSFFNIGANDRVVFSLNGNLIPESAHVIFGGTGMGIHDFGDGNGAVPFNFANTNWQSANPSPLTLTDGFVLGGINRLIAHMNNTGTGDPSAPATDRGLSTAMYAEGKITYSVSSEDTKVPEPSMVLSFGLLGLALIREGAKRQSVK